MWDDFKWKSTRQTNEGGSPINSWERKTYVTTRHQIPPGGDIWPPPSKTIISESISVVNILTWVGGTTISWRSRSCLRYLNLHGKEDNEIQWDNKHQQKQQRHTVWGGRSLHWTWVTRTQGGGGLREAVHRTRYTIILILRLIQIISSVASGPGCHG